MALQPETASDFPMTVKQFLSQAHFHLKRGDIVLSRGNNLSSRLIRWATDGHFSHSALVFLVPHPEDGFANTFVLESVTRGVGLANLRDYIAGRNAVSEIAVLRLEGQGLDDDYFKRARGLMLDRIKAGYDYQGIWFNFLEFVFGLKLVGSKLRAGGKRSMRDAVSSTRVRKIGNWVPPQYICSGFIQYGFTEAARHAGIKLEDVIIKQGLDPSDRHGLLATTPEDIAQSDRLTWRFVARRGWVHRVASYDEGKSRLKER